MLILLILDGQESVYVGGVYLRPNIPSQQVSILEQRNNKFK